jgi:hypothetical protein
MTRRKTPKRTTAKKRGSLGPYAETMAAAAGKLGVSLEILQAAKDAGCEAFRATRVYLKPLRAWIATAQNAERIKRADEAAAIIQRRKTAEAELKEEKVLQTRRESMRLVEIRTSWFKNVISAKTKFKNAEAALCTEAAMRLNLTADQIAVIREIHARLNRQALTELFQGEWGKVECPECKKEFTS